MPSILQPKFIRRLSLSAAAFAASIVCGRAYGQEVDESIPVPLPPPKEGMQITFLPPPMKGTIGLGIYDATGKLVRVLHRDATEKAFVIGLNGLITRWDGRDDRGEQLPAGAYSARGWMVGDLNVDGVAFHGNDWVRDDGPRHTEVLRFEADANGKWQIVLKDLAGAEHKVDAIESPIPGTPANQQTVSPMVENGKLSIRDGAANTPVQLAEGEKAIKAVAGFKGLVWAIVESPSGRDVRAYTAQGEFFRRLAFAEGEPAPFDIASPVNADEVLLLERSQKEQRFRRLAKPPTAESTVWKTIDQKQIVSSHTFEAVASDLRPPERVKAEPVVKIFTKQNPLLQNERSEAALQAIVAPEGAMLATADGLPLLQLTETKNLKWAVLVKEGKALTLFQSDGAVVEEFKLGHPENLMSFDAGEYTLKK